jgi:hypothetical protein
MLTLALRSQLSNSGLSNVREGASLSDSGATPSRRHVVWHVVHQNPELLSVGGGSLAILLIGLGIFVTRN